ncbi:MAG: sigma-54 dependent transcriptional regulator [Terriglobales bacterium]
MGRVLIVDDERHMHKILASNLEQDKHTVSHAAGVEEARLAVGSNQYEAVLTDQKMPDGGGLDVLAAAREADPNLSVIFLTAVATLELAVESMRKGAFDFLAKPFTPEVLRAAVQRACDHTTLVRENSLLKAEVDRLEGSSEIFGDTPAMREVREKIARVAPTAATVLITGETGTGKELVARAIHRQSPRAAKPFLAANCAAFTETLLESELFGHERGAFTGADRSRLGLFEAAHEGTLFLDEVAEMSPAAQAKLLRVLTDGQVMRIGSVKTRSVDVRVLAATHRELEQRVKEGLFREDLYYRLAVVPIAIPPLRERTADVGALCDLFLGQIARELKLPKRRLSTQALFRLQAYEFPGNIRELRNLIERAVILSPGEEIGAEHFPLRAGNGGTAEPSDNGREGQLSLGWVEALPASFDLRNFLSTVEKTLIERTLQSTRGAQAEAARRLGLSRSDLSYKLLKYELRKEAAVS